MSGHCDWCGVWHSGSCCHPGRVLYQDLERKLAECERKLHFQGAITKELMPYQERAVEAERKLAECEREKDKLKATVEQQHQIEQFADLKRVVGPLAKVARQIPEDAVSVTAINGWQQGKSERVQFGSIKTKDWQALAAAFPEDKK